MRNRATFGMRFPNTLGMWGTSLNSNGSLVVIAGQVELRNGFGALKQVDYECSYFPRSGNIEPMVLVDIIGAN